MIYKHSIRFSSIFHIDWMCKPMVSCYKTVKKRTRIQLSAKRSLKLSDYLSFISNLQARWQGLEKQESVGSSPALSQIFLMLAKLEERPKCPPIFNFFLYYATFSRIFCTKAASIFGKRKRFASKEGPFEFFDTTLLCLIRGGVIFRGGV